MLIHQASYHDYNAMLAALPAAVEEENRRHGPGSATLEDAKVNLLDYVAAENFEVTRRFPTLAMAKSWVAKQIDNDCFGCVEAETLDCNDRDPWDCEAVERWHFDGNEWLAVAAE